MYLHSSRTCFQPNLALTGPRTPAATIPQTSSAWATPVASLSLLPLQSSLHPHRGVFEREKQPQPCVTSPSICNKPQALNLDTQSPGAPTCLRASLSAPTELQPLWTVRFLLSSSKGTACLCSGFQIYTCRSFPPSGLGSDSTSSRRPS